MMAMPLSHSEFSGCRWVLLEKEAATQTEYKSKSFTEP